MNFVAVTSVLGLLILLDVIHQVDALGWAPSIDQSSRLYLDGVTSGEVEMSDEFGLFVKYKNEPAKEYAKARGKQGVYDKHFSKFHALALRAENRTALNELLVYEDIDYVEPIHRISTLPIRVKDPNATFPTTSPVSQPEYELPSYRTLQGNGNPRYGNIMVQATDLWGIPPQAKITVCIIDTGYGLGHPDLPDLSYNVTGSSLVSGNWEFDALGHGTHVAGIIGALSDSNKVEGVMKDQSPFRFHIAKSIDDQGMGTEADLLDALENCLANNAKVISMSIGGEGSSATLGTAFKDAYDQDVLLVAAAGNDGKTTKNYPASYPHVMSVAAVDENMNVASFSQFNDQVEIAGPGVDIYSTITTNGGVNFDYAYLNGTSMATPYVAGVAAQVWAHFPQCTNNQIRNALLRTALDADDLGCTPNLGFGIVQAKAAYDLLITGCDAGEASPDPLSFGGIGGCLQDPQYEPPPTPAPTDYNCAENIFELELTTDFWGEETSWEVTNSVNHVVGSGGGYAGGSALFIEWLCLPPDEYTFTIMDSASDGICCYYGLGSYSVYYKGHLVGQGAQFTVQEKVDFGCVDDDTWIFTTNGGKFKQCNYIATRPDRRCDKVGVDQYGNETPAFVSCPDACDSCPIN